MWGGVVMRVVQYAITDVDQYREEAHRAKHRLDVDRWRAELRPRAMQLFASRAARLTWSRALLNAVVEELYPDDLFSELIANLDRVPPRQWPGVVAIAVALRHSWRQDQLARFARRLGVSLPTNENVRDPTPTRSRPSRSRFSGSPRPRQGSRFARPARAGCRP
jgi:hypothetical protein